MRAMILACILLALGALSQARAQNTGTLTGSVGDSLGKPIRGATVRVLGVSPVRGAISRENGSFIIPNLPCGRYSIRITAVGYPLHTVDDVEISDNSVTQLDVCLPPSPVHMDICAFPPNTGLIRPEKFGTITRIMFPR